MKIFLNTPPRNKPLLITAFITALSLVSISASSNANEVNGPISEPVEVVQQLVSLNESTLEDLITLKGVGKKKAQAILAYRELYGDFKTIDELMDVKGIGSKIINANKSRLKI